MLLKIVNNKEIRVELLIKVEWKFENIRWFKTLTSSHFSEAFNCTVFKTRTVWRFYKNNAKQNKNEAEVEDNGNVERNRTLTTLCFTSYI